MPLQIGYAQTIITPSLERPVFLAGFGHNRRAVDVHDDLYARAVSIRDGSTTLVLCAVDLIGLLRPFIQELVQPFQADGVEVVVASTHTHHGPDTFGMWGPKELVSGVDPLYMATLRKEITAVIQGALRDMKPAQAKAAAAHVPGVAKNARDPLIIDDELTILQFQGLQGPLATLVIFPCHPEVLWEHNPHLTADYPATLRQEIEAASGAPCLFFAGALGGMMTPDVVEHSFAEAEEMGTRLAKAALRALEEALDCSPIVSLRLHRHTIHLKLTNILYKIAFLRKVLPDTRDSKGCLESEVNLIQMGDVWLATVPGELLPKLGLRLKADVLVAGARLAGVIGLANDELGYILPAEDFKYPMNPFRPGNHYEETNSIGKDIGPRIIEAFQFLLRKETL